MKTIKQGHCCVHFRANVIFPCDLYHGRLESVMYNRGTFNMLIFFNFKSQNCVRLLGLWSSPCPYGAPELTLSAMKEVVKVALTVYMLLIHGL